MVNEHGLNGNKPSPPDELVRPVIEDLVRRGYKNWEIVEELQRKNVYNTAEYSLSLSVLKKKRSAWKLYSSRGQSHTVFSIGPAVERMRTKYPTMGAFKMKHALLNEENINVSKKMILQYMQAHHPGDLAARRANRLVRRQFWCIGVNDVWSMDQHDKWRKFELYLHICIETYSSLILWLRIWWTNRNPRLICGYYLDTLEEQGYIMPLLTQSDPGTENNNVANAQTLLRHRQDPDLADSLQHKFVGGKRNIKPEIAWRLLRQTWTPGFEELLNRGLVEGIYNPDDILERFVFHYIFIPWLQKELDIYRKTFNDTRPRYDRRKILPRGRPIQIFENPEKFHTLDFAIIDVEQADIDDMRAKYAPPDAPCFELVPPRFAELASQYYANTYGEGGMPEVNRENAWQLYLELLEFFRNIEVEDDSLLTEIEEAAARPSVGEDPEDLAAVLDLPRPRGIEKVVGGEARVINGKHRNVGGKLIFEDQNNQDEDEEDEDEDTEVELEFFEWSDEEMPGADNGDEDEEDEEYR
ncbi:hypothetical protein NM688_g62 [Phlebia brevispora]|uniref:Uncharacterized protein n=1 Tax=Phlebia brevispora TaxID=194682 RepID=A0ACC1TFE7_9APHY|nr:hypothetical protein NM688_g62 [Phlebia brevispora]